MYVPMKEDGPKTPLFIAMDRVAMLQSIKVCHLLLFSCRIFSFIAVDRER